MSVKIMNDLIAKRANIIDQTRKMVEAGVKPEQQDQYNLLMNDFNSLTKQIEDLRTMEKVDDILEDIATPNVVDEKKAFENFIRFGDTSGVVFNSVTSGSGSAGYLVPEDLRKEIVRIMYEAGAMMNLAQVINTTTLTDIPIDGTAPTAYWIAEEGAFTDSSPTVNRVQLGANKLGVMVKVSEELLSDSAFDVESYVAELAGTAMGRSAENEFINGTVSGRPSGLIAGTFSFGLTSSVTNSFNYEDLVGLFAAVKTPYANKGAWLTGRPALGTIMTMKDAANQFVFQPSYDAGQPDRLLSRPLHTSEYMPALTTTAKGIAFGDFSHYKIAVRGGMSAQRLNERYADTGQVGFRFWQRLDGKMALAEAVKYLVCK